MRSLGISEKTLGSDSPKTGLVLNNLGDVYFTRKDWKKSVAFLQRGATLTAKSVLRQTPVFASLMKAAFRLAELEKERAPELTDQIFRMVQQARDSEAAAAISQMAVRTAKGDTALGKLVREHQDYTNQWQLLQKQLTQEMSKAPALRTPAVEAEQRRRLNEIAVRVASIDSLFLQDFPEFAALTDPKPVSIAETQSLLGVDEALILIFDTAEWNGTPEETFVWAVTKTDSRWVRSDLGSKALLERVAALRCGLDATSWSGEGNARCNTALGLDPNRPRPKSLPFDPSKAHVLYHGLLGNIEDLIVDADGTGKNLLIVPSGALTALPLQVLVTEQPKDVETGNYTRISWLAKRHALTTLPSVASLRSLRRGAKSSAAPEPFVGFGDPALERKCGSVTIPDKCPDEEVQLGAVDGLAPRSVGELDDMNRYFRGGLADVAAVKSRLCPLPDTAFELKCIAKSLGAPTSSVVLGPDMTETRVKQFPISRYRVVHFATHGLLAGETAQLAASRSEPALVMSPPDTATEFDDGLLTASEIADLKLDADWVVMSACNTAGGDKPGAEALTGLAKAFFYAGARALLVSHWPVNSYAATMLTSWTFAEVRKDPAIGRSEAFRRAMLTVMSNPKRPGDAHPSVWSPFVVVGEGGAVVAR
jgi:CHAT domain-containing protein